MNNNTIFIQSPREILDYTFDFTDWLNGTSNISDSIITVDPNTDLVVSKTNTTKFVRIIVSGGVAGTKYKIRCKILTDTSLAKEAVITIHVKDN